MQWKIPGLLGALHGAHRWPEEDLTKPSQMVSASTQTFHFYPKSGVWERSIIRGNFDTQFFWFANFPVLTFTAFVLVIVRDPGVIVTHSVPPGNFFKWLFLSLFIFSRIRGFLFFSNSFCLLLLEHSVKGTGLRFQTQVWAFPFSLREVSHLLVHFGMTQD